MPTPGVPESFKVLVKELQALCLDIQVLDKDGNVIELKDDDDDAMTTFNLSRMDADREREMYSNLSEDADFERSGYGIKDAETGEDVFSAEDSDDDFAGDEDLDDGMDDAGDDEF